ncbi:hypothetical protein D3D02_11655 [Halobellus sp. Atlit-38R]|uniref:hypothetical protein n=1 Tax=Halobellus sp. Atlit-38R TaxID=2282131 RepID=UPI000EF1E0B4|nr:hypothetical protein [Halobellus sp. Atlit-38R]RLM88644.1 hypothetical protein D3D02_11655 [Halobellus sp. Atlit-38R]
MTNSNSNSRATGSHRTRRYYDFFGDLLVAVVGDGGRTSTQYRQMYDQFLTDSPSRDPDLVIEEAPGEVDSETVLGDPTDHYGWTGEEFLVYNRGDYMVVEPGWEHIRVTPGFEPFYSIYPMEFEIRRRRIEQGQALIHASGVTLDGQTTLFPAWRGAGKTNTLLALLRNGADFLSDDRLWVGADGSARGYPLGVNLQPYNLDSFTEIEPEYDTFQDRLRHDVHAFIDKRVSRGHSLPHTAIGYLNNAYLADNDRDFVDVTTLYSAANDVERASVDNVLFLEAAPNAETVSAARISTEAAMAATSAICNYEWDGRLREYFHAYDSLVEGGTMVETLDEVVRSERDIFRELFDDVVTYRAQIPRERDWTEHGLDRAIVETVRSLESARTVEATD